MTAGGHGFDGVERRGLMFVLSSPSGAGKTTLSRLLIERMPDLKMSVSATTRPMRPGEVEGHDYLFVDQSKFEQMAKRNELLEWATVFENRYGTPRAPVEAALSAGQDVLFDIDWQGTQQLREKARADVVSVFILPPSAADLEERLHSRAQDSGDVIRGRMSRASHEMSHWAEYDYIVINHDIDEAFAEVQSILKAERLRRERRTGLTTFVRELQRQLGKEPDARLALFSFATFARIIPQQFRNPVVRVTDFIKVAREVRSRGDSVRSWINPRCCSAAGSC